MDYVDDLITGAEDVESAFRLYKLANSLMSSGGFYLRKWNSNTHSLLQMIRSDQGNHEEQSLTHNQTISKSPSSSDPDKLLGVQWIHDADEFKFHLSEIQVHARG